LDITECFIFFGTELKSKKMNCRHCEKKINHVFVDLNHSPIANSMLNKDQLNEPECHYPLKIWVCDHCFLVQMEEFEKAENIFDSEYTYFSSFSTSWLAHAEKYVDMMMDRFHFDENTQVIEVASNDGYLLQYFKKHNVPVLGIDPTANTAQAAEEKGIKTLVDFFSSNLAKKELADKNRLGDLIIANNVLLHVPHLNDFVKGMKVGLKPKGIITAEFQYVIPLINDCKFDTIYQEHYSYLSFHAISNVFESQGLEIFDVEELPTHGKSLRIFGKHKEDKSRAISERVTELADREEKAGVKTLAFYENFQERVDNIKYNSLAFLIDQKQKGKKIIGYGAAAKGNTFLNYCGIKGTDIIHFVVDASPHKQNKYLPGSHIPVYDEKKISEYKPDYVIILPWNLKEEISEQLSYIRDWGGKFVIFIPEVTVF